MTTPREARVVAGHGRRFVVETADGVRLVCLTATRGVQPVCGDRVTISADATPDILEVLPRVLEAARDRGGLDGSRPFTARWLKAIHQRPSYQAALLRGGPYRFA